MLLLKTSIILKNRKNPPLPTLKFKHQNSSSSSVFVINFVEIMAKDMKTVFFESEKMVVSSPF